MITMLEANRKPKKKRNKQNVAFKSNSKVRRAQRESKIALALRTAEYFNGIYEALDWIEDHFPDIKEKIADELDAIKNLEQEWMVKLNKVFIADGDVNNLLTYAGRHFYKKELVDFREDIRKSISMRGVKNHHSKPYLLGTSLLLLIALELQNQAIEVKTRSMRTALKEYGTDLNSAAYAAKHIIDSVSIPEYDKPVKNIIDKFQEMLGMPDRVFEEYMLNDKIGKKVYDYSVAYHTSYSKKDIIDVSIMVKNEKNCDG